MDTVSNALSKIKNAYRAKHNTVVLPASWLVFRICNLMIYRGFLHSIQWLSLASVGLEDQLVVTLKYTGRNRMPAIKGLKRISKPGARIYLPSKLLPILLGGVGLVIVSTSLGIMSGSRAKSLGVGGEVMCYVW